MLVYNILSVRQAHKTILSKKKKKKIYNTSYARSNYTHEQMPVNELRKRASVVRIGISF